MTMRQCGECGEKFIGVLDDEFWCPECRMKKHQALSALKKEHHLRKIIRYFLTLKKEGDEEDHIECPHCHQLVKRGIYQCSCGKKLREDD